MDSRFLLHLVVGIIIPVVAEIEMEFTRYPESVVAPVGDEVTFECSVSVPGERMYWRWKAVDNSNHDWRDWKEIIGTNDKDGVTTRLVFQVKEDTKTSLFQCVVRYGGISLVSIPARLSVAKVDLSKNTAERRVITAPLHNTIVLHCKEPLSEPPAVLSWWKDNGKGIRTPLETKHGVLIITNATIEDSGTYGCVATNDLTGQIVLLPEITILKVQHEGNGGVRFLEEEYYVGTLDKDGVLTAPVRPGETLRLWCGAVATPPPRVVWTKDSGQLPSRRNYGLTVEQFTPENEGIYSCSANGIRRSWKAISLQPPHWEGAASWVNASEGGQAHVSCGMPYGTPAPQVHWVLNSEPISSEKGIRVTESDLYIDKVEKKHAGIVQCFACNWLGCAYDAAMLTVVPVQISDQDLSAEEPKTLHNPSQLPKRHNRKNSRKHKAILIPPSRPNVTRLSDESVMVTWSHAKGGLPVRFFKVQYREVVANNSNIQWQTAINEIPPHIHSFEVNGLSANRYYKFRIAAVYSNQDNKMGRSSSKFYLQQGGTQSPRTPILDNATALSPHSIQLNWTWSSSGGVTAEGFYVYYRTVSTAGDYEKATVGGGARSAVLDHLLPDTAYELKIQAYTAQAPSEFSAILMAKTQRAPVSNTTPNSGNGNSAGAGAGAGGGAGAGSGAGERGKPGALVAGGAGAAALLLLLALALLLCRRVRRPSAHKEKGSAPESGGTNGYIPAKVPITITANPMHAEGSEGGVEMSFLHNNNCGNTTTNDDTLPHSRKNGPTRQYV